MAFAVFFRVHALHERVFAVKIEPCRLPGGNRTRQTAHIPLCFDLFFDSIAALLLAANLRRGTQNIVDSHVFDTRQQAEDSTDGTARRSNAVAETCEFTIT
ncbi:hypothetical protein [Neisseria sp.]|uniref:hypothetical protein n=1 Tax=Neisseria sp. TaxID=192066 RepID=UPI0026DD6C9F|nr:hypothetical protein [Neisseria sp.]MDO4227471.1 hypothetical protein [Neisseria sp.]